MHLICPTSNAVEIFRCTSARMQIHTDGWVDECEKKTKSISEFFVGKSIHMLYMYDDISDDDDEAWKVECERREKEERSGGENEGGKHRTYKWNIFCIKTESGAKKERNSIFLCDTNYLNFLNFFSIHRQSAKFLKTMISLTLWLTFLIFILFFHLWLSYYLLRSRWFL